MSTIEPAVIEGLEESHEGALARYLLHVDELLAAAKLTSGDDVLHVRDHH